jgi:outer membrane beta-barrel protein
MNARRGTLLAAVAALACAAPQLARAQSSKADAFAGKIPPVSGQLYGKDHRWEATLNGLVSVNDAFFNKYFVGARIGYHFTEHWSLAVGASGGLSVKTGSAEVCSSTRGCSSATEQQLRQVPGRIRYIVGAEAAWTPIYGKLNVLSEQVAHFDLGILAGPDLVAHDEVLAKAVALAGKSPGVQSSFGGHVGLGARLFVTDAWAVRLDFKDYIYAVAVPNTGSSKDVQNQLFTELGVSYFFPARTTSAR